MDLSSDSFVEACARDFVDESVADQNGHDQDQVDAAGERIEAHLVEVIQRRREDEALHAQQHEQRQLTQARHERQQETGNDRGFLDGDDDAGHALDPGNVLNDGRLFDLARQLEHGVEAAAAGKRDILDRADDDQQRIGIEQVQLFRREQDEECDTHSDGRHQIRQERNGVHIVCPAAAAVLRDGVADHRADGAGQQRAGHGNKDRAFKRPPDRLVIQDALLAIHTVFRDVFRRDPPFCREVRRVACVQERIIARIRQERLKRKGDNGEDACEERENHKDQRDNDTTGFAERDLGDLAGLAGDGRVILAAFKRKLVQQHDCHAEDHHDNGKNARFARILGVHRDILG